MLTSSQITRRSAVRPRGTVAQLVHRSVSRGRDATSGAQVVIKEDFLGREGPHEQTGP